MDGTKSLVGLKNSIYQCEIRESAPSSDGLLEHAQEVHEVPVGKVAENQNNASTITLPFPMLVIGNKREGITVPLKSKLPPPRETRISSLEQHVVGGGLLSSLCVHI